MYSLHGSFTLIPLMTHQAYIVSKLIWGPGGYSTSSFEAAKHISAMHHVACLSIFRVLFLPSTCEVRCIVFEKQINEE